MTRAVVVGAVRTAGGRRNGRLSGWHPAELAAETLKAVVDRTGVDVEMIEDVIMGCVTQVGLQSTNVGRTAVLAAGWPETIPATTIDRQCGSSQQAIHFAAQGIMAGAYDVVVAAGVESMSRVPMFSNAGPDMDAVYGPVVQARYGDRTAFDRTGLVPQGISAELVVDAWQLAREELDAYALRSHQRAAEATAEGRFDAEIVPVAERRYDPETGSVVASGKMVDVDEGIRDTSAEALAGLKPAFVPDGTVTAGNSSQITDGAAAMLLMSEERAAGLGLPVLACIAETAVAAADPVMMLTAPIPATRRLLERADLGVDDVDLYEVNEAFACVVLAWQYEIGAVMERVNVNGGGIALGHPLGASGVKLATSLVHELGRREGRYGLLTMCESGGMANATLFER